MKYFVKSKSWNVLGDELTVILCEYEDKVEFRQPHFERCWSYKLFETELAALEFLRTRSPDRTLTVLEDTGKVVSTFGHESGITSMKIQREADHD